MTLCAERQASRDSLTLDMPCFLLGRVCHEDVGACLGSVVRTSCHRCRAFRRPLALRLVALCPQSDTCPHLPRSFLALSLRNLPSRLNILWGLGHCSVLLHHLLLPPPAGPAAAGWEASAAKGRAAGLAQRSGLPRRRRTSPGPGGGLRAGPAPVSRWTDTQKDKVQEPALSRKPNIRPGGTDGWDWGAAMISHQISAPGQRDGPTHLYLSRWPVFLPLRVVRLPGNHQTPRSAEP